MSESIESSNEAAWKEMLRDHWKIGIVIVAGLVVAFIGALFVFLWRVNRAPVDLGAPVMIGDWTVGLCLNFLFNIILWEFLLVGLPVIAAAIVIFALWWNKLPAEKKEKYKSNPHKKAHRKRTKAEGGGGVVSFIVTIIWLIIVWNNGYWNTPFSAWILTIWVNFMLQAFLWFLLVAGTPLLIGGIWWLRKELKQ